MGKIKLKEDSAKPARFTVELLTACTRHMYCIIRNIMYIYIYTYIEDNITFKIKILICAYTYILL